MSSIRPKKYVFALDCADARALAGFYAELLGWEIDDRPEYDDWVDVLPPDGGPSDIKLGFQRIADYRAPVWPDGPIPQQAHLDFYVDSIAESSIAAEAAGAVRHSHQPSEDGNFVVFLDPAGHPFCLCEE